MINNDDDDTFYLYPRQRGRKKESAPSPDDFFFTSVTCSADTDAETAVTRWHDDDINIHRSIFCWKPFA